VNISSKLEEKTKEYGAQIIISGDLVDYMSEDARSALRVIDKVSFIDKEEMNIYTVDVDLNSLSIETELKEEEMENNKIYKFQKRNERKEMINNMLLGLTNQWIDYEENNEDWEIMRRKYKQEFFDLYLKGFNNYILGNWEEAKEDLNNAVNVLGEPDRPSLRILGIMQRYGYVMPIDWDILKESDSH
jgi:hypothetical protein